MPIPDLVDGFLPPGVHECSLGEVRERFGQFRRSDRRVKLQAALEAFVEEARGTGLVAELIVNGSFTTDKAEPEDVDIIVVLEPGVDLAADFRPDQYNVLSARRVKSRHGFDVLYATAAAQTWEPMVAFFAEVRGQPGRRKGMVRIAP